MNPVEQTDASDNLINLSDFLSAIDYRVARTKEELEKAYFLVYKEYLKRGYTKTAPSKIKLSVYNVLPQATTFVAISGDKVIATATLVPDSPIGLPMEQIFHEEVNQFRLKDMKLCEISMLASDTELFQGGVSLMIHSKKLFFIFYLFKLIFDYAREIAKLDFICITINPKHELIYNFLFFKEFGGLKTYPNANDAPAVAMHLDLRGIEEQCKKYSRLGIVKMFFASKTEAEKFSGKYTFTDEDLKYFFAEKSDILKTASPEQLEYIKNCYPNFDFLKLIG